jgi:anti-sigma factor RsiW
MTELNHDDRTLLIHAALDGELDAAGAIEMERMLAADPELSAEYARLVALRNSVRRHAPRDAAPQSLKMRILASLDEDGAPQRQRATPKISRDLGRWRELAAAIAATVVITLGAQHLIVATNAPDPSLQSIVAAHMRSQISGQPVDVASSDRHTVKPWLASKLPAAAVVVDLASEGFPLLGGRVDIIEGAAEPTLVYKRREHFISVTELPSNKGGRPNIPQRRSLQGYPAVVWSDGDHAYVAVSDLAPPELDAFVAAFRSAASKDMGEPSPLSK